MSRLRIDPYLSRFEPAKRQQHGTQAGILIESFKRMFQHGIMSIDLAVVSFDNRT